MEKLIFSQSGVYRLQQLASQVHSITGVRYRLSDSDAMLELLRKCSRSGDKVIQTYFAAFSNELDDDQMETLVSQGVQPRLRQTH